MCESSITKKKEKDLAEKENLDTSSHRAIQDKLTCSTRKQTTYGNRQSVICNCNSMICGI